MTSGHSTPYPKKVVYGNPRKLAYYMKESLAYGISVYMFSHQLLAVLVLFAHTAVK